VFSWDAIIRAYTSSGLFEEAIELHEQMERLGVQPDKFTFPCVLKACGRLYALTVGKAIRDHVKISGFESDVYVGNALVALYTKCGSIEDAVQLFDKISQRDVVSWTSMIGGYVEKGFCSDALEIFHQMEKVGMEPDPFTFASVLRACAELANNLEQGKEIHYEVRRVLDLII
jgi:pentatricopeptide repeat protein